MANRVIRFLVIFLISLPVLFFIHTGFLKDSLIINLQVILFVLCLSLAIVWKVSRKYILLMSLLLIIAMATFYIFDLIYWADIMGSTAIGLVVLVLFSNLSTLFKKGYVEKL